MVASWSLEVLRNVRDECGQATHYLRAVVSAEDSVLPIRRSAWRGRRRMNPLMSNYG